MIKNPIYQFEDETSMGIDVVPDDVVVLIKDYDSTGPKQVLKVAHGGLTNLSTIEDFILTTGNWIEVGGGVVASGPDLAIQAEVNMGTNDIKYVSPLTLANSTQWDEKIDSDTSTALTGIKVENLVVCSQAQYDGITPDGSTVYMIR